MKGPKVADYMHRDVEVVTENQPLRAVVELNRIKKIRNIPVLDDHGALVGIVTDRDIRRALPSPLSDNSPDEFNEMIDSTLVERVMTREPLTIGPDEPLADAILVLVESHIGSLPVVRDGKVEGMLTTNDGLRAYLDVLRGGKKDAAAS